MSSLEAARPFVVDSQKNRSFAEQLTTTASVNAQ